MALFTLQVEGLNGPVITVVITVSEPREQALRAAGSFVPQPQVIRALVDTGASGTCVDPSVLQALQLTPTGSTAVHTPSSGPAGHQTDLYDVGLMIPGVTNRTQAPLWRGTIPVMSSDLAVQGIHALIGRDILADCVLVYNGQMNLFTLAF